MNKNKVKTITQNNNKVGNSNIICINNNKLRVSKPKC